jgi:hypothetical protein
VRFGDAKEFSDGTRRFQLNLRRARDRHGLHGGDKDKRVAWVMLNPSYGGAAENDPTIRRCIDFSCRFGFESLVLVNLFAFITAYPRILREEGFPVGDGNDDAILAAGHESALVIAGWGEQSNLVVRARARHVFDMLTRPPNKIAIECLGVTSAGAPRHPSRRKSDALRIPLKRVPWCRQCGRNVDDSDRCRKCITEPAAYPSSRPR